MKTIKLSENDYQNLVILLGYSTGAHFKNNEDFHLVSPLGDWGVLVLSGDRTLNQTTSLNTEQIKMLRAGRDAGHARSLSWSSAHALLDAFHIFGRRVSSGSLERYFYLGTSASHAAAANHLL